METIYRVAILDTLVDGNIVDAEEIIMLNNKELLQDKLHNKETTQTISHGTLCAKIIKKYDSDAVLICIKVLEEDGSGSISELKKALEWCYHKGINIINLSLGVVNPMHRSELLLIVNYFANRGMIIIAATSNNGLLTYPASFSNVIGVASDEVMEHKYLDSINLGIDIQINAEHVIEINDNYVKTPKGNSFATPYVSAIVAKIIRRMNEYSISAIKSELYNCEYCTYPMACCNEPDWISSAYFANSDDIRSNGYYFDVADLNEADTIIVDSKEMLEKYKKYNKHMVFMGEEEVESPDLKLFFWSRKNKIQQIQNVNITENKIEIPILILEQSCEMDEIEILNDLKKRFKEDGYSLCAFSTKINSVLYDIEYIPEELLEQKLQIYSFVYWKTYLRKSSIVILASNDVRKLKDIFNDMDAFVKVDSDKNSVQLFIMFEGRKNVFTYNQYCSREISTDIYVKIRKYFNEINYTRREDK